MSILYLDVDDEITSAASRIRTAAAGEIALVLQAGSRIATSRINFRLLAREAQEHDRQLVIVAPESSARALAAAAGLPVFATVMEYEEAVRGGGSGGAGHGSGTGGGIGGATADGATPGRAIAQARRLTGDEMAARDAEVAGGFAPASAVGVGLGGASVRDGSGRGSLRAVVGASAAGASAPGIAVTDSRPVDGRPVDGRATDVTRQAPGGRRPLDPTTGMADRVMSMTPRRRRPWKRILFLLVVLIALLAGGVAGYTVLPGATVTLAVRTVAVGPVRLTVHADPSVLQPDDALSAIPAISLDLPLSATGTFKATGKRIDEQTATGTVKWSNCDPTQAYTIPNGTTVRTATGTAFQTGESIFLPVAILNGSPPQITCQSRTVGITAVKKGLAGNVPAGAITVVPGSYNSVVIRVTNPAVTAGGTHVEFPKILQKDVTAALAALGTQIDDQLAAEAAAPNSLPEGTTVYPETAVRGDVIPNVDPAGLVDQEVDQFDLGVTASGSVLAVDPSPIQGIGEARVLAAVPAGTDLVAGSEQVTVGPGVADTRQITFQATARGSAVPRVDQAKIREAVRGRTPDQARDALAGIGDATIVLWPDWTRTITTLDMRLEVRIEGLPSGLEPGATDSAPPPSSPPTSSPAASPSPLFSPPPADSPSPTTSPSGATPGAPGPS